MSSSNVAEFDRYRQSRENGYESDRAIVRVGEHVLVGANKVTIMAGPCSVESEEQLRSVAQSVARSGAAVIRGGIFKPRTSPYTFQGLGKEGVRVLTRFKEQTGLPIVSEVIDLRSIEEMASCVDLFQVGSRNMYNYPLLKELGSLSKPVLLKRGFMATIDEFIGAAEYILSGGNSQVILCERGIRSFDSSTRFCLDLNAIPVLRARTKLPIVVDPSHGTGVSQYVEPMSLAAIAAGADGLLLEVHNDPGNALSDGAQALTVDNFDMLAAKARRIANAIGRSL